MTKALSKKRRPGVSVRLVTQASDTPIATATMVARAELTRVLPIASAVIARLNLFQDRVLKVEAPRAVSIPAGATVGMRARTASFRQAGAEPPQLFPFRDVAGADLQCFLQRQFSF